MNSLHEHGQNLEALSPEELDNLRKRELKNIRITPSIKRVIIWNALGAGIILAIFLFVLYYLPLGGVAGSEKRQMAVPSGELKSHGPRPDDINATWVILYYAAPLAVLGVVAAAMAIMTMIHLREIPRYVDLDDSGVRLGLRPAGEVFISYREIKEVYERSDMDYADAAVCFKTASKTHCIITYPFPEAKELYRQLLLRTHKGNASVAGLKDFFQNKP